MGAPNLSNLRRLAEAAERGHAEAREARADAERARWAPLAERESHARRANAAASRARSAARALAAFTYQSPEAGRLARRAEDAAALAEHDAAYSTARAVERYALGDGVRYFHGEGR